MLKGKYRTRARERDAVGVIGTPIEKFFQSHYCNQCRKLTHYVIYTIIFLHRVSEILQYEDMVIDIPKMWVYIGQFIGAMVAENLVQLSQLKEGFAPLFVTKDCSGVLLAETLKFICDKVVS